MRTAMSYVAESYSLLDAVRERVSEHLQQAFNDDSSSLASLDHWTRQRSIDRNLAKVSLIFESDNPIEACYHDLIRDIDAEAETGIFQARADSDARHLRQVVEESGVTGALNREGMRLAHDLAHLDASVAEIAMCFLMDDVEPVQDMVGALRSFFYTIHEDAERKRMHLPLVLGDAERRDLEAIVAGLREEAGNQK